MCKHRPVRPDEFCMDCVHEAMGVFHELIPVLRKYLKHPSTDGHAERQQEREMMQELVNRYDAAGYNLPGGE